MQHVGGNRRRRARRTAVAWLVSFLAIEIAFGLAIQGPLDCIRNPAYASRSAVLREMKRKSVDRPLVLVLGSSRAQQGVRPDLLNEDPAQPLVYNFGRAGHGPRHHCITLKRLLRDGLRPDVVILELAPHQLAEQVSGVDQVNLLNHNYQELLDSLPFRADPEKIRDDWVRAQIMLPCFSYRYHLMSQVLASWNPAGHTVEQWRNFDPYGWLPYKREEMNVVPTAEDIRSQFQPALSQLHVHPSNQKAIEEIFNDCRHEGIAVAVLFMPEGPVFRGCYSPQAEAALLEFQQRLARFPGVTVINAREWLDAEDYFVDSHHIEYRSAPLFTQMFARRVIPLLPASTPYRSTVRRD
jgi:hypothetical protein